MVSKSTADPIAANLRCMRLWLLLLCALPATLSGEESWTRFHADSFLDFEVPSALVLQPGSGDGEAKWVFWLQSPDGAFKLESCGFRRPDIRAAEGPGRTRPYLIGQLLEGGGPIYRRFTPNYLLAVYINRKRNEKTLVKYWVNQHSRIFKSLTITFPYDRRAEFDPWLERIEASWDPQSKLRQW